MWVFRVTFKVSVVFSVAKCEIGVFLRVRLMIVGVFDCMWDGFETGCLRVHCGVSEVQWLFWVDSKYF